MTQIKQLASSSGISSISSKGQVVIPKKIRQLLELSKSDKLYFELVDNKIVVHPIPSIEEAMDMIADNDKTARGKKPLSKKEMKQIIAKEISKRYQEKHK